MNEVPLAVAPTRWVADPAAGSSARRLAAGMQQPSAAPEAAATSVQPSVQPSVRPAVPSRVRPLAAAFGAAASAAEAAGAQPREIATSVQCPGLTRCPGLAAGVAQPPDSRRWRVLSQSVRPSARTARRSCCLAQLLTAAERNRGEVCAWSTPGKWTVFAIGPQIPQLDPTSDSAGEPARWSRLEGAVDVFELHIFQEAGDAQLPPDP
jgi:hypothetical protein